MIANGLELQKLGSHWHLKGSVKWVGGITFNTEVPYDAGSGSLSGKRQHTPVVVGRKRDNLSPHIQAAWNIQLVIPSVTVTAQSGETVSLTNVRVNKKTDAMEWEEIELTYQTITVTYKFGKSSASDDWNVH